MRLPVFFFLLFAGIFLLMLIRIRISVELAAKDTGITYTIQGSLCKFIKVFEIKSGSEKKGKKRWRVDPKEKRYVHTKVYSIFGSTLRNHKGKILHIEKLEIRGTFSIEDAAGNAILYGILMVLWQYLLIFLTAHFSLEHQNFKLLPDFKNNRNEMAFHAIFRVIVMQILFLILWSIIESRRVGGKKYLQY